MARITAVTVKQEPAHYTVTIRKTIHFMKEYTSLAEKAFDEIEKYIGDCNLFPVSGPVTYFHNTDLENLDVEVGWQTAEKIAGKGEIVCSLNPGRKIVTAIDMGPYEQQDPTLEALFKWIGENKAEVTGPIIYCYLNDTKRPPAEYLTQMAIPIA